MCGNRASENVIVTVRTKQGRNFELVKNYLRRVGLFTGRSTGCFEAVVCWMQVSCASLNVSPAIQGIFYFMETPSASTVTFSRMFSAPLFQSNEFSEITAK